MDKINRRKKIIESNREIWAADENGDLRLQGIRKESQQIINSEPEYTKIYFNNWKTLATSGLSETTKSVFISIANRMEYCNKLELRKAQTVTLQSGERAEIMAECGITNEKVLYRHLKALVDCDAIRPALDINGKKRRSVYQVNPLYASKGHWHVKGDYPAFGVCDLLNNWNNPNMHTLVATQKFEKLNDWGC